MNILNLLQDYHMNKFINFIWEQGEVSRVELSKRLGIPKPTVTRMIEKLINEEIIIEKGLGDSSGGRRPVLLSLNSSYLYSIGVEIGRPAIKIAVTNLGGDKISSFIMETNNQGTIGEIVTIIKEQVDKMLQEKGINITQVLGIGIGLPGPITESPSGLITIPNFYDVTDVPLRNFIQKAFILPVTFDINANVAALAEKWFGKGKGCNNFVFIMAEAGIGSGIILNGELYRGSHAESGIIGHSTVNLFGEKCSCGNYGCLETLVSTEMIIRNVQKQLEENPLEREHYFLNSSPEVKFEEIVLALQKGSEITQKLVQEAGHYLGVGIANVISFYDPESIILGGRMVELGTQFMDSVENTVKARVVGYGGKCTSIIKSELNDGVVLGAAALVINEAFTIDTK